MRSCGSCTWWEPPVKDVLTGAPKTTAKTPKRIGTCGYPLPVALYPLHVLSVAEDAGIDCKCWTGDDPAKPTKGKPK